MNSLKALIFLAVLFILAFAASRVKFPAGVISLTSKKALPTPVLFSGPNLVSPEPTRVSATLVLDNFRYPGAKVERLSDNTIYLKTADGSEAVISWYKNRINDSKMTVKNFIQTNTNGYVSGQLVGVNKEGQVKVILDQNQANNRELEIMVSLNLFTNQRD